MSADPQKPKPARYVAPNTRARDIGIAVATAIAVLAAIIFGTISLKKRQMAPSRNQLTGTITAKHDLGEREEQISIGRKGLKTQAGDSGYSFDVRVEPEGRTYEVPVTRTQFETKKVGDKQTFIRPPSEQR
jgi:hypothetical protein